MNSEVPPNSVFDPFLYLIFTVDIPKTKNTTIATFTDDTAIIAVSENSDVAS